MTGPALPAAPSRTAPRPPWIAWAGLAVILAAAAVLSFAALRDLAIAVRIHRELAWLLPVAVDAGAAVSCSVWLSPRTPADAARFARSLTWGLLVLTVAGNAGAQGMAAAGIVPPWWVAVLVGAIPPAVVGGVVHLVVLLVRTGLPAAVRDTECGPADDIAAPEDVEEEPRTVADLVATRPVLTLAPDADPTPPSGAPVVPERAEELIAEGAGRKRLAAELGVSEHAARGLLARARS